MGNLRKPEGSFQQPGPSGGGVGAVPVSLLQKCITNTTTKTTIPNVYNSVPTNENDVDIPTHENRPHVYTYCHHVSICAAPVELPGARNTVCRKYISSGQIATDVAS